MNNENGYKITNKGGYTPLRNFGRALAPQLRTDPVGYSIYRDTNSFFDEGSLAHTFGPATVSSQAFMAERCSKEWDGACELLSRNNDTSKPNVALVNSPAFQPNAPGTMSIGDYLVLNSAIRRFGNFDTCVVQEELYNPNDPTSPFVKTYGNKCSRVCMPVCKVPENPDADIILNKVLYQPHKFMDLLTNMYYHSRDKLDQYKNTRIGKTFELIHLYFSMHN